MKLVGVADIIPFRKNAYSEKHKIDKVNQFDTWEQALKKPKFADAMMIALPDNLHFEPCLKALDLGYDVLLEKPMAQTEEQCRILLKKIQETGKIVAVCHVLRYAPYFTKLREIIQSGAIGEVISLQHLEPIHFEHMAHSYVRGNWHRSKDTTPIILAKSCHDLDIMNFLMGKKSKSIQAFGSLKWFKRENAPVGSGDRCISCNVEKDCPYSAVNIYQRKRTYLHAFDLPTDTTKVEAKINEYLEKSDYGRCVYKMDNDQPDHYICNVLYEGEATASLHMEAFTSFHGRRTRVFGSMGDIVGDMEKFTLTDFKTGKSTIFEPKFEDLEAYKNHGHGGGDWALVNDFIQAVAEKNPKYLVSSIKESIESHVMGFAAEKSRLNKTIEDVVV
jgi:hypothetical protein